MNINERADISRRYLLQKGETVSAKTVEDLMLELNAAKETVSELNRKLNSSIFNESGDVSSQS